MPGGRPKIIIDYEQVARLAHIHCTHDEIASILGVSVSLLEKDAEFLRVYKKGLDGGKKSLRRVQWATAEGKEGEPMLGEDGKALFDDHGRPLFKVPPQSPNVTMQIWLGKQALGQKDLVEHDVGDHLKKLVQELAFNRSKT